MDVPDLVRFSIVVPVYEQWHQVPELLRCLFNQTLSQEAFQVILVDNGSPDFKLPSSLPANVTILRCHTPGSYAARNHGAKQARGEWLMFTDADCRPVTNWLTSIDQAIGQGTPLVAGAVHVVAVSQKPASAEIYDMVKGIPQERYSRRGYAATANLAVRRDVFELLGGFDAKRFSGGDAEFCRRAGARGFALTYAANAVVEHPARTTWHEIATKARRVKGGQLTAGRPGRRALWLIRTLLPPVKAIWTFARDERHPVRHRVIAILVLLKIWGVEILEVMRLAAGQPLERR